MNKYLVLLTLGLSLMSCSKNYNKLSFLNLDEYKNQSSFESKRIPANIGEDSCFIEDFSIEQIKLQIKSLEKSFNQSVSVPSKYRFYSFNPAETHYIKRFNEYMYFDEQSKNCESLPCLLNRAYGNSYGEEGYRIYHWFLTMGSGISTLNKIPKYKTDPNKTLSDYLFPNEELKLLNMVSHIISKDYRNILVSTIHRFPNETSPGEDVAGLFSYSWSNRKFPGTIFLTNQNMDISKRSNLILGYYIHTIVHELSHALDFTYGKREASEFFSSYDQWVNLSWKWGESKVERIREVNGVEEKYESIEMGWIVDESKLSEEGFVRNYQRVSHKEDFADTGANFLLQAEKLKKISPTKHKIFQDQFYKGKNFLKEDQKAYFTDALTDGFKDFFWDSIKNCSVNDTQVSHSSTYSYPASVQFLGSNQKKCIKSAVELHFRKKLSSYRKSNYLACSESRNKEKEIIQRALNSVEIDINSAIDEIGSLDGLKDKWKELRLSLENKCSPVTVYLKNRKNQSAKALYTQELKTCTLEVLASFNQSHELFDDEVLNFVKRNTFESAKSLTRSSFINLSRGIESVFSENANELIDECRINREESLNSTVPVDGGIVFVQASTLNCINERFQNQYDQVLSGYLQEIYNFSSLGLEYMTELYQETYINTINKELLKLSSKEKRDIENPVLNEVNSTFEQELNRKDVLQEYFREKTTDVLFELISNKYDSLLAQYTSVEPITISKTELIQKMIEQLKGKLKRNSEKEAAVEIRNVRHYIENSKAEIYEKTLTSINWKYISGDLTLKCPGLINSYLNDSNYQGEINYYTQDKIKSELKKEICSDLAFAMQVEKNELKDKIKLLESSIKKSLNTNFSWKLVFTKDQVRVNCNSIVQKNIKELVDSLRFHSEVNSSLIERNSCYGEILNWEKESSLVADFFRCNKTCSIIQPNSSNMENALWKSFFLDFVQSVESNFLLEVKKQINEKVEECKIKYPQTQYLVLKLKRKRCLESIEANSINLSQSIFSQFGNSIIKSEILRLKNSLNDHL